jgi:hypothetical protein
VTSYAVTARVQPASPRIRDHSPTAWSMPRAEPEERTLAIDPPSSPPRPARLDTVRVTLLESTFYLFDPEGWR